MAATGDVEENDCEMEGLRLEMERMALEDGLNGILVAMLTCRRGR